MKKTEVQVNQIIYEDFSKHDQVETATATKWWNGEGVDIHIQRRNMSNINISLTYDNISLFRKIFSDLDF